MNQSSATDKFVSLGIYYFGGDGHEFVILRDSTGEAAGSSIGAFDAVKFVKQ